MWVANKGVQSKLEELPIPFSDVRNIVEELYLEDELTRSRCRAWLVLSSHKYLQADIIFPGCIVDCRVMIRPLSSEFLSFLPHCQTITCVKKKTGQNRKQSLSFLVTHSHILDASLRRSRKNEELTDTFLL